MRPHVLSMISLVCVLAAVTPTAGSTFRLPCEELEELDFISHQNSVLKSTQSQRSIESAVEPREDGTASQQVLKVGVHVHVMISNKCSDSNHNVCIAVPSTQELPNL